MDWCIDTRVPGAAPAAQADIAAHLARHALDPQVAELAQPLVHHALSFEPTGAAWVAIDWQDGSAQLIVRRLGADVLPGTALSAGVTRAHEHAAHLAARANEYQAVTVDLAVVRPAEGDIDPEPSALPAANLAGAVAAILAAETAAGRPLAEGAARAGASLAASRTIGGVDATAVAAAFLAAEAELGADFHLVHTSATGAVLTNRRCPFGPSATPALCRVTSALAGGLAARAASAAEVTLDERLSLDDHQCRLHIDLAPVTTRLTSHRYIWPPAGVPVDHDERPDPDDVPGFRITLSLQLPRDRLSVPVTRHLISAALDEVGVIAADADAVELAVTEACANVIDHAGPGDCYDVVVALGPSACHIRVVDVGRGFDHTSLAPTVPADGHAEDGRGMSLMHALVDHVRLDSEPERGTIVHLVKALHFDDSAPARRLMLAGEEARPD